MVTHGAASRAWTLTAGLLAAGAPGCAPAPATVNLTVDATAAGTPLERVWAFHGWDEINDTTTPEGTALLGAIARRAHRARARAQSLPPQQR